MDMSLASCWDCPSAVSAVMVAQWVGSAVLAAVGVWLLASRLVVVRVAGMFVLIVTGLFYLFDTYGILHYGLVWSAAEPHTSLLLELVVLVGWYGMTAGLVAGARWRVGRERG
jgi:hypothetical protein